MQGTFAIVMALLLKQSFCSHSQTSVNLCPPDAEVGDLCEDDTGVCVAPGLHGGGRASLKCVAATGSTDCGLPFPLTGGRFEVTATTYGSVGVLKCDNGYTPSNSSATITCMATARWSESSETCDPVDCGMVNTTTDGNWTTAGSTYLEQASHVCPFAHYPSPVGTATCMSTGRWCPDPTTAVCDRFCEYSDLVGIPDEIYPPGINPNNASSTYDDNVEFIKCYIAEEGQQIKVSIYNAHIEYHSSCSWDYIQLYDEDLALDRLCGTFAFYERTFTSRFVQVKWRSDCCVNYSGYRLVVEYV